MVHTKRMCHPSYVCPFLYTYSMLTVHNTRFVRADSASLPKPVYSYVTLVA